MEINWLRLFLMCTLPVNHPQNFFPPICTFMELRSNANLPCLVNLALSLLVLLQKLYPFHSLWLTNMHHVKVIQMYEILYAIQMHKS